MQRCIGVRREDKSQWERRTPITPTVARTLAEQHGIQVVVQPASQRAFSAAEFEAAGARVQEDLPGCPVVLGIKEIPKSDYLPDQAYVFFAHVIKGQPFNMPMLQRMLDLGYLLAPGSLFHARREPSTLMRINFATTQEAQFWEDFQRARELP